MNQRKFEFGSSEISVHTTITVRSETRDLNDDVYIISAIMAATAQTAANFAVKGDKDPVSVYKATVMAFVDVMRKALIESLKEESQRLMTEMMAELEGRRGFMPEEWRDSITLEAIRSQLDSLRDNARSFLQPDEPNSIWQDDIDAIDTADDILGVIASFGFESAGSFTRWLAETQELEQQYAKHLDGRPHKKPPDARPLDMLGLRHTTIDALRRNGVTTIGQLENLTFRQIRTMSGIGQIKIDDINCCLKRANKRLREEEQP